MRRGEVLFLHGQPRGVRRVKRPSNKDDLSAKREQQPASERREFCGKLGAAGAAMIAGAAGGAAAQAKRGKSKPVAAMVYDVRRFGASGEGKNDTAGLQAAIDACTGAGGKTRSVVVMGSDLHWAERAVAVADGVPAGEVQESGNYVER